MGHAQRYSSFSSYDDDEEEKEASKVEETDDYGDEEDENEEENLYQDEQDNSEAEENDDDRDEEISGDSTDSCSEDDPSGNADDEKAFCIPKKTNKSQVVRFLEEGKDLEGLGREKCEAYLRKHRLRLTGTNEVRIQRIKEHWRIKNGDSESFYPISSFGIDCQGDVCEGDVVLFKQHVYAKYNIRTEYQNRIGTRTVAGRVIKESYGLAKQQHTFTVEVLWSKLWCKRLFGTKKLRPLFPLLVKGRNLYKLKTLRQLWNDEDERSRVLSEKHRRGADARAAAAVRVSERSQKMQYAKGQYLNARSRQFHLKGNVRSHNRRNHTLGHSQSGHMKTEMGPSLYSDGNRQSATGQHLKARSRQFRLKGNVRSDVGDDRTWRHSKSGHMNTKMDPSLHFDADIGQDTFPRHGFRGYNLLTQFARHGFGLRSTMVSPLLPGPYAPLTSRMFALQHWRFYHRNGFHHCQSNPSCNIGRKNLNHFPVSSNAERQFHQFSRVQRTRGFQHYHPGKARFNGHRNSAVVHFFRFMVLFSTIGSGMLMRS
ncbi:SAP domain-containing protein [Euphorbia peplus]|nr:SAP domain-containing protein [Euphorbia peplus]